MKQVNLSNKKIDLNKISAFDKTNIISRAGKPFCGLWFSPAIGDANSHLKSEWHNHVEFSWNKDKIAKEYLTKNDTTYVTELSLKENTKTLTVSEIGFLFSKNASKDEIINKLKLQDVDNLVLKIDSQKDLDLITINYPNWDDIQRKQHSKLWQYITENFVGCEFSENLFKTVNRLDSDLVLILDTPSFAVFDNKGFNFKTTEEKLIFNTFEIDNNSNEELTL